MLEVYLLRKVWALWAGLLLPAGLLFGPGLIGVGHQLTDAERTVAAGVLELGGLALIAMGYVDVRASFGRPTLAYTWRKYWRDFADALRGPRPSVVNLQGRSINEGGVGSAQLTILLPPDAPLADRLKNLEARVDSVDAAISRMSATASREREAIRKEVTALSQLTSNELSKLRGLVEQSTIGDAGVEVLGWLWLCVGVLTSAGPSGVAVLSSLVHSLN